MRTTCMLCCMRAFAASRRSGATSSGSVIARAGAKKFEKQLTAKLIAQICGTVVAPKSSRTSTPRPTSLAIMVRRESQRSANIPATGPRTIPGTSDAINTLATSLALPCMRKTIATCTANSARKSPTKLMVCATHSRLKGVTREG